jgi:putative Mg2+ transporter-C (MgtC) family protein
MENELEKELFLGWPEPHYLTRVVVRLCIAAALGGVVGLERERTGKAAGVRTHMLVALGAALFTMVPLEVGMKSADFSRIIQGLVTGIGFLGGGVILKANDEQRVHGLTTAAGIWATAAVGMAIGAGWLWPALCGTTLAWIILHLLHALDRWKRPAGPPPPSGDPPHRPAP